MMRCLTNRWQRKTLWPLWPLTVSLGFGCLLCTASRHKMVPRHVNLIGLFRCRRLYDPTQSPSVHHFWSGPRWLCRQLCQKVPGGLLVPWLSHCQPQRDLSLGIWCHSVCNRSDLVPLDGPQLLPEGHQHEDPSNKLAPSDNDPADSVSICGALCVHTGDR